MGRIAEPKGVDFLIQSPPLSDKERKELSDFIKTRKAEAEKELFRNKKKQPKKKPNANNV
ncbi:MAG TPA: hypothetical protein VFD29_00675 [Gillisia sp.]|nr:hypothetical protein [Gillisia sp.]